MSKKKIAMLTSVFGLMAAGATTVAVGKKVYDATFGGKPRVAADQLQAHYSDVMEQSEQYPQQKFFIESSKNNYQIETLHLKSNTPSEDVMVLIHGIKSNYYEILSVAFYYLEHGFNVIVYHQRQTGLTGGKNFTFGLYERFDLAEVVNVARRLYPQGKVGVHGFSMGAATAVLHTELNEKSQKVDFYVMDAPYHTMESSVELGIKAKKSKLPIRYVKWAGNTMLKIRQRVNYKDIEPLKAIAQTKKPILLLHGTEDKVTDPKGSQLLYDAVKHDNKRLHYLEGAAHCVAHRDHPEEYFKVIYDFMNDFVRA